MANLPETITYDAGVYQLETTDQARGGSTGVLNTPLKNLTNRTAWLKAAYDALVGAMVYKTGDTMTGDLTISKVSPTLFLDRSSGASGLKMKFGGLDRWGFSVSGTESGADSGSTFYLQLFTDAGTLRSNFLQINRSDGRMGINGAALAATQFTVRTNAAAADETAMTAMNTSTDLNASVTIDLRTAGGSIRGAVVGRRPGNNNGDLALQSAVSGTARDHLVLKGDGTAKLGIGASAVTFTSDGRVQVPSGAYLDGFPSGTSMLFVQTSAPTGWTKSTAHNDKALRVVSGTAGSGGSVGFSAAFTSRGLSGTVQGHTLTWNEMPYHTHPFIDRINAGGLEANVNGTGSGGSDLARNTDGAGGGWAHDHPLVMNNLDMAVQYVDSIIATKD